MSKESKVLELVRNLLARAEHPNTPKPEADLAMQQANKLMAKHAIDEALLDATLTEAERKAPTRISIKIGYRSASEFFPKMRTVLRSVAYANRCKHEFNPDDYEDNWIYGFAEDVRWVEMLFTVILADFLRQVNPKWDNSLGLDANVYNFKSAGYKWRDIHDEMLRNGGESVEKTKMQRQYVIDINGMYARDEDGRVQIEEVPVGTGSYPPLMSAYKRHAKKVGDEFLVKTSSHEQYREQFTLAFTEQMVNRLHDMRNSNESEAKSMGAELALVDRSHLIDEAIWKDFPHMHPDEIRKQREAQRLRFEKEAQEREDLLDSMTKSERRKFLDDEERARRKRARMTKGKVRYVAYQSAASARGRSAADSVDLSRKRHTDGRGKQGSIG